MAGDRPIVTFDLDGVLCRPPFGLNPGRLKETDRTRAGKRNFAWLTERFRYYGRSPMPGAAEGIRAISAFADCVVLTARGEATRGHTEAWLRKNLRMSLPLHMRPHWRERPPQFKARKVRELGAAAHFEDDPNTAAWIAERLPVFVVAWGRNAGLEGERIERVPSVAAAVDALREMLLDTG